MSKIRIIAFLCLLLDITPGFAEPWLANRLAQNCSGCHAPSRRNLPVAERRCTLTCQGCHLNPNGGGMRSAYGKWTQQRWLRSIPKTFWQKKVPSPAPLAKQAYANQAPGGSGQAPEGGHELVTAHDSQVNWQAYDRSDGQEMLTIANKEEFLERIPAEDPYRSERRQRWSVGLDYRYMHEKVLTPDIPTTVFSWPMSLDIGFRYSAIPQNLDFVYEARFMQGPQTRDPIDDHQKLLDGGAPYMRSAYALWHQIPYNTYVTAGVYRPLFGFMIPDHTALSQLIAGFDQFSRHGAMTIGAAPNVPFINIHGIFPYQEGEYGEASQGFAANIGGRFVTLGTSIMASYWQTTDRPAEIDLRRRLASFNVGMQLGEATVNLDYLNIERERSPGDWARGKIYTFDLKYRTFRQNYLAARYEDSPQLKKNLQVGWTRYQSIGFKTYWYAGLETELLYRLKAEKPGETDRYQGDWRLIQLMVHLFI
ncbi:MAG: hypothetical protein ACOH5I_23125 [Oligoflexus sp.]